MQDITYRLVFTGQIREGASLEEVKARTARRFKLPEAVVDMLFSGGEQIIKRHGTRQACEAIKRALDPTGAISRIERELAFKLEPRMNHPYHQRRQQGAGMPCAG